MVFSCVLAELLLEDMPKYKFLSNGDVRIRNIDDSKEFAATNEAFHIMGLTNEQILDIWRVVSAVLLFGNIEVTSQRRGGEQAVIQDDSGSHLLQITLEWLALEYIFLFLSLFF